MSDDVTPARFARVAAASVPILLWWSVGLVSWVCAAALALVALAAPGAIAPSTHAVPYALGLATLALRGWWIGDGWRLLCGAPLLLPLALLGWPALAEPLGGPAAGPQAVLAAILAVSLWQWGGVFGLLARSVLPDHRFDRPDAEHPDEPADDRR